MFDVILLAVGFIVLTGLLAKLSKTKENFNYDVYKIQDPREVLRYRKFRPVPMRSHLSLP